MKNILNCKPTKNEIKFNKLLRNTKKLSMAELIEEGEKAFQDAVNKRRKKRERKKKLKALEEK